MTSTAELIQGGQNEVAESATSSSVLETISSDIFSDLTYAREIKAEEGRRDDAIATALDAQKRLDESVRPYLDFKSVFSYYESSKAGKASKPKPSPTLRNSEEGEASATDDATPPRGAVDSDGPALPPTTNGSKPSNDVTSGKYPFPTFTPITNFEEYLSGAPEMTYRELYHRAQTIAETMMKLQNEWDEVDGECYDWEEAEKAKSKTAADDAKIQAEMEQSEEDSRIIILQQEYKTELLLSRKDWLDGFSKQHMERVEDEGPEVQARAQATLDLLNKIRDPLFMKGFQRRQRALLSQKWDSRLVEKPLADPKQTKEERDLEERKRRRLTDRITFDDMNRADAYGYTYNAMDLSRGDQKLPNLRVVAKAKDNKRNSQQADSNGESSRPIRSTRKGVITESGENSEAASATEEETPLPEKRRGRGQTTKFIETMNSGGENTKKSAKTYVGEDGVRRYVGSNKPSGRPAAAATIVAKSKGKAVTKSKLDQMSRAVSESVDEVNGTSKRKSSDYEEDVEEKPRRKRAKTPAQPPPMYFPPPLAPQPAAILPSINSMLNPEPPAFKTATNKRKRNTGTATSTPAINGGTAENTDDEEGANGKKPKKPRNKTEAERAIQSAAMKLNWSNPNGKMRMGIERRNRRAARKKTENTRLKNGGAPNDNVIYKSDEEGFSYAYFNETPPVANPNPAPAFTPASASASVSAAPSGAATTATNTPARDEDEDDFNEADFDHLDSTMVNFRQKTLFASPAKKTRVGRVTKPTAKSFGGFDGAADDDYEMLGEEGDSERGEGESVYQTFQKIISPGHDLGKRVSRPRMKLDFVSTTDEEVEVGEDGDTDF